MAERNISMAVPERAPSDADAQTRQSDYERQCRELAGLLDEAQEDLDRHGPVSAEELRRSLTDLFAELRQEQGAG